MYEVERKIEVEWARAADGRVPGEASWSTPTTARACSISSPSILSDENTNIRSLEAQTDAEHGGGAIVEMTVDVRDKKQLEKLVAAMRRISGVRDVERLFN